MSVQTHPGTSKPGGSLKSLLVTPESTVPRRPGYNKTDFDVMFDMKIELVPREKIRSDTSLQGGAQRIKNEADVEKLRKNLNVYAFNPVKLSYRAETDIYLNISGQTREGLFGSLRKETGDPRFDFIPAIVFQGLSRSDEAEILLYEDRGQKRFSKAEVFYAAKAAGDVGCLNIWTLCTNYGIEISNTGRKKAQKNHISAVAGMWDTADRYGVDALQAYLELYLRVWETSETASITALGDEMIRGGIRFYRAIIDAKREEKGNPHYQLNDHEWEEVNSRFDQFLNNPDKITSFFHEESEYTDNRTLYSARSFLRAANINVIRKNARNRLRLPSIERKTDKILLQA